MPTPIQRPEQALALAKSYNIKGKLPLKLDEVVVPVHIVGELAPDVVQLGPAPALTAKRYSLAFNLPAAGANNHPVIVIQYGEPGEPNPKPLLVESFQITGNPGSALIQYGVGIGTGVAAALAGPQRMQQLERGPLEGPGPGPDNVRAWAAAYLNTTGMGSAAIGQSWTTATLVNPPHKVDIITGVVRSSPYWLGNPGAITPGNMEFWMRASQNNAVLQVNVIVSVLNV